MEIIRHRKLSLKENFNYAFKYSANYTFLAILVFAIARSTGYYVQEELRFVNYILLFPVGYFGVKAAYQDHDNHLNYFGGLMIGFLIGLLGQTWYAILFVIYLYFDPVVLAFLLEQLPQPLLYPHLAIGFILISSTVIASSHHSGATLGSFGVDQSGAANYSIPLQLPPGIGGMQPTLSLNYSSQGGNGLLGVGW